MNLAELNRRVTSAIFRAERLAPGTLEAQEALSEVSLLEEEIATQRGPSDVEGALAREGAVRAALNAGECLRALSLASRFLEEDGVPPNLRAELEALQHQSEASLPDGSVEVTPARMAA